MSFFKDELIEQVCQQQFDGRRLRLCRVENTQYPFSNLRRNRLQSRDEICQKACGVVIPFVQRQPGDRSLATGGPFADQAGFTKAGGGRDKGQLASKTLVLAQTLVQPLDQAGAEDGFRPRGGILSFVAKVGVDIDQHNVHYLNLHLW